MRATAILWDLDGTLVDSEPLHARATDDLLAALGLATPAGFHARALGLPAEDVHALLVAEAGMVLPPAEWEARKFARFQALAATLPARQPAAGLVPRLAARGIAQAVVSNSGRAEVDLALAVTGLGAHMALSVAREDVARGKPDPEGYAAAAAALGHPPEATLAVEDSRTGAEAARAAGLRIIFHPQHPLPPEPWPAGVAILPPEGDLAALIDAHLAGTAAAAPPR